MVWQGLDYVGFLSDFADRIYHVDCKDTKIRMHNGRNGRLSSHLPWADPRRGWDFISTGHGDTRWEDIFRMLNHIGYAGPISIEWEDAGMDRLAGAPEALEFIRAPERHHPTHGLLRRRLRHQGVGALTARLWHACGGSTTASARPPANAATCGLGRES